jgi:hypothetical protein
MRTSVVVVDGVDEAGRFSKVAFDSERVRMVILEKLLLVRRVWRIAVPMLPLACCVWLVVFGGFGHDGMLCWNGGARRGEVDRLVGTV